MPAINTHRVLITIKQLGAKKTKMQLLGVTVALAGIGLAAAKATQVLIKSADTMTNLSNKTGIYAETQKSANFRLNDTIRIARLTNSALDTIAMTYQRVSLAASSAGIDDSQISHIVENLAKAVKLSGATSQEADGALRQFGQGLAANRLSGQELNSVLEQTPLVAKLLADSLGVATGALRQMGKDGELTSDVLVKAFGGSIDDLEEKFAKFKFPIADQIESIKRELDLFFAAVGEYSGAAKVLQDFFANIKNGLIDFNKAVKDSTELQQNMKTWFEAAKGGAIGLGVALTGVGVALAFASGGLSLIIPGIAALGLGIGAASGALNSFNTPMEELMHLQAQIDEEELMKKLTVDPVAINRSTDRIKDLEEAMGRLRQEINGTAGAMGELKFDFDPDTFWKWRPGNFVGPMQQEQEQVSAKSIANGEASLRAAMLKREQDAVAGLVEDGYLPLRDAMQEMTDIRLQFAAAGMAGSLEESKAIAIMQEKIEKLNGVADAEKAQAKAKKLSDKEELDRIKDMTQLTENWAEHYRTLREEQALMKEEDRIGGEDVGFLTATQNLERMGDGATAAFGTIKSEITDVGGLVENGLIGGFNAGADAIAKFAATGEGSIKKFGMAFLQMLTQMIVKMTIMLALQAALGFATAGANTGGTLGGGNFGGTAGSGVLTPAAQGATPGGFIAVPRYAAGGPVRGGVPIMVGERGPEMFVPPRSGSIANATSTAGMQQQPVNVTVVNVDDPKMSIESMNSEEGEQVILNVLRRNPDILRSLG